MDRDFWESFINLYKLYPCIWNSKSPDYNNKNLRDKAYSDLVDFCKTRYPSANKDYVVKKIHSFRCSFRRELRKVLDSQKSGASLEDIYTPHLWYYDLLYFITEGAVDLESNDDIVSNVNVHIYFSLNDYM